MLARPFARIVRTSKLAPQRFAKRRSLRPSRLDRRREKEVTSRGNTMSMQSTESSHPLLSHTDSIAASSADAFLLVGRVLLGWLFLASSGGIGGKLWNVPGFAGYLKNLGMPAPEFWSWIGAPVERSLHEPAIRSGEHILASKKPCIAQDALGHQFGVLDDIGRVADDTWDKRLARRKLHVLPHLPLVRMARIGTFDDIGTHIHL